MRLVARPSRPRSCRARRRTAHPVARSSSNDAARRRRRRTRAREFSPHTTSGDAVAHGDASAGCRRSPGASASPCVPKLLERARAGTAARRRGLIVKSMWSTPSAMRLSRLRWPMRGARRRPPRDRRAACSPCSRHVTTCQVESLPPLTGITQSYGRAAAPGRRRRARSKRPPAPASRSPRLDAVGAAGRAHAVGADLQTAAACRAGCSVSSSAQRRVSLATPAVAESRRARVSRHVVAHAHAGGRPDPHWSGGRATRLPGPPLRPRRRAVHARAGSAPRH